MDQQAVQLVAKKWGRLGDLPCDLVQVIWVTACQGVEAGLAANSPMNITTDLLKGGTLVQELRIATERVNFLDRMILLIRKESDPIARIEISNLAIDVLKWNIVDAGSMSEARRWFVRKFAKPPAIYDRPVPREIL